MTRLILRAHPRIHICLVDVHGHYAWGPGGAGFAIDAFPTVVSAQKADAFSFQSEVHLDASAGCAVNDLFDRLDERFPGQAGQFVLESSPHQHIGLGSKTSLMLAIIQALSELHDLNLPKRQVQLLSQRGGTSGVGVNTFFDGGLVIDLGRQRQQSEIMLPSSAIKPIGRPKVLIGTPIVQSWAVYLFINSETQSFSGADEVRFFQASGNISMLETGRTLGHLLFGVLPSFLDGDIQNLRMATSQIQQIGFKRKEIESLGGSVKELIKAVGDCGCVAGLSALGPTVYAITSASNDGIKKELHDIAQANNTILRGPFEFANSGYTIDWES